MNAARPTTLLFGLGATKAGTSWLYRYLAGHPDCYLRSLKELHFFDTIDTGRVAAQIAALERQQARIGRRQGQGDAATEFDRARRIADIEEFARVLREGDEAAYAAYLDGGRHGQRLIADITPSYALLSEGRLERMAGMSADVRFIYLLRDPVARLWSHVHMIATRRGATGRDLEVRAGEILERTLSGAEDHIVRRGDYSAAIGKFRTVLDPSRLMLTFYEELFTGATIGRICAFLGIDDHPARFGRRVHEGQKLDMSVAQHDRAAEFLRPQYEFVAAALGRVPAAWGQSTVGV